MHAFFFQTSDKRPRTTTVSLGCTMFRIAHASASTMTLFRFASITTITLSPGDASVDFGSNPAMFFPCFLKLLKMVQCKNHDNIGFLLVEYLKTLGIFSTQFQPPEQGIFLVYFHCQNFFSWCFFVSRFHYLFFLLPPTKTAYTQSNRNFNKLFLI